MTTRKPKSRQNRPHSIGQQPSDYDSDLVNFSDAPPPPPPTRTNGELNLSVIRRHNSSVRSILSIAPYAVLYLFAPTTQQWEKSGIEGTLFICQLSLSEKGEERYAVTLLNRRGLDNFETDLLEGGDVEITDEYVILRVADEERGKQLIYGLWIFSEPAPSSTANTRIINAQIIQDCAVQAETSRRLIAQKHQEKESSNHTTPEVQEGYVGGAPMGRQLSLRELFGQQRQHDDEWSVKDHSPQIGSEQFTPSADTDSFHSTKRYSEQQLAQHQQTTSQRSDQGQDVLGALFRKAAQGNYNGP
ncbi:MAG: hypothetical protein M1827_000481 [Pycnora praestabilis]|nr:MAG: hypothetical protein M1827_000481 [Pycnora praestabilis]